MLFRSRENFFSLDYRYEDNLFFHLINFNCVVLSAERAGLALAKPAAFHAAAKFLILRALLSFDRISRFNGLKQKFISPVSIRPMDQGIFSITMQISWGRTLDIYVQQFVFQVCIFK